MAGRCVNGVAYYMGEGDEFDALKSDHGKGYFVSAALFSNLTNRPPSE